MPSAACRGRRRPPSAGPPPARWRQLAERDGGLPQRPVGEPAVLVEGFHLSAASRQGVRKGQGVKLAPAFRALFGVHVLWVVVLQQYVMLHQFRPKI